MAVPKKGFRKITVNGEVFLWKVRKKVSWEEVHNGLIGIPVQHINEGALLVVKTGYSRSYFEENNEFQITPLLIKKCIDKAIKLGWDYSINGPKYELDCSELVKELK